MQRELLTSEYDDIRTSIATVISLCHLLAEKVRTLLMLSKARDVYKQSRGSVGLRTALEKSCIVQYGPFKGQYGRCTRKSKKRLDTRLAAGSASIRRLARSYKPGYSSISGTGNLIQITYDASKLLDGWASRCPGLQEYSKALSSRLSRNQSGLK